MSVWILLRAVPVVPGELLYAEVGATGGGAPGGGNGNPGGAESDVRTCSTTALSCSGGTSADSVLVVAGGGGGAGGGPAPAFDWGSACGVGGGAGSASDGMTPVTTSAGTVLPGMPAIDSSPAIPAGGGGVSGAGAGGSTPDCTGFVQDFGGATDGSGGNGMAGGAGATPANSAEGGGGGGGTGYFGGGGGQAGQLETRPDPGHDASDGGGGGAGASFYSASVTGDVSYGHNAWSYSPSVTITPLIGIVAPADGATYTLGQVVDANFSCAGGCQFTPPVPNGSPLDTSSVGVHSFTLGADNATSTVHYTVVEPPSITTAASTTLTVGHAGSFVFATGPSYPASPSLSDGNAVLPTGVTFTSNGDGTATLKGNPHAGTAGTYPFTVTASNGASPDATQAFTLTIVDTPGAPSHVAVHPVTGALGVSWSAPSQTGGSAITHYTATAMPGGATCTTAGLSCTIGGLTATTRYTVSVSATNAVGAGLASTPASAYPATVVSLKLWSLPLVAVRNSVFTVGIVGATPGATVNVAVPHSPALHCVADAIGQCVANGLEPRTGVFTVVATSGKVSSSKRIFVPSVAAPRGAKVATSFAVTVRHCPARAMVSLQATGMPVKNVAASEAGFATIHVKPAVKGTLVLTVSVSGVTVMTARVVVT